MFYTLLLLTPVLAQLPHTAPIPHMPFTHRAPLLPSRYPIATPLLFDRRLLARAARRRPHLVAGGLPTFHAANLSDAASSRAALAEVSTSE